MNRVTIIPDDHIIYVDDEGIIFDYYAPINFHAIQYRGDEKSGVGHVEYKSGIYVEITEAEFVDLIQPYVELFNKEKEKLIKEKEEAEKIFNSEESRFERLRQERNLRLQSVDYMVMPDYPLKEGERELILKYRQSLRDLPTKDGAPWDGGNELTPWPEFPI